MAYLRSVRGPIQKGQTDLQLELGASAIIGKALALGLTNEALKDIATLKARLEGKIAADGPVSAAAADVANLMVYPADISASLLSVVTTTQLQVLRLIVASKKPAYIEAVLPFLKESHLSSPIALTTKLAKSCTGKELEKTARQMASLSQILLSLAPSVAAKDDTTAMEPRLSPSPTVALELQGLALRSQLRWWKLAGHKGKIDQELLTPLGRCMRAFERRQDQQNEMAYDTPVTIFNSIMKLANGDAHEYSKTLDSPLATIYQILGKLAQTCKKYDLAHEWFMKLKDMVRPGKDASVLVSTITANCLSISMRKQDAMETSVSSLQEATECLDGPLSGTASELNDLLDGLSSARRSVVMWLVKNEDGEAKVSSCNAFLEKCQRFILQFPRFLRRWLGSSPDKDAEAKVTLQFDERRRALLQIISPTLDGVLMVIKNGLHSDSIEWRRMDEVLQDCLSLLGSIKDASLPMAKVELFETYHLKVSLLYFGKFSTVRKDSGKSKEKAQQALQSINRSINAVKDCSSAAKEKARLIPKLEVFADMCKAAGRTEDAVKTLRSICTTISDEGVLTEVASVLDREAPLIAWSMNDKATLLSRTLRSIVKVDRSWSEWTVFLADPERAAALEHLLHIMSSEASGSKTTSRLSEPGVSALLRLYSLEEYPIRRLRVLLQLFYQSIGQKEEMYSIRTLLEPTLEQVSKNDLENDAALQSHVKHYQNYHKFVTALVAAKENSTAEMYDAVLAWKAMVKPCQNNAKLLKVVADPDQLLDILGSTSEYASLRGESQLQLALFELSESIARITDKDAMLISSSSRAISLYVSMGLFTKASQAIEKTRVFLEERPAQREPLSEGVMAEYFISKVEYYSGTGDVAEAVESLSNLHDICNKPYTVWASSKPHAAMLTATASLLMSAIHLQKGQVHDSMSAAKSSVRSLSHEWAKLEAGMSTSQPTDDKSKSTGLGISNTKVSGPAYWRLANPLLRSLLQVSAVYAHIGIFQETVYYADNAWQLALNTQSDLYKAQVSGWLGSVYSRASQIDKALSPFESAESCLPKEACSLKAQLSRQLGDFYLLRGNVKKAHEHFQVAEETTRLLNGAAEVAPESVIISEPAKVTTKSVPASRVTRTTRARSQTTTSKAPKAATKAKAKAGPVPSPADLPKDVHQASLVAGVALSRAMSFVRDKKWSSALSSIEDVKSLPKLFKTLSEEQVVTATSLIGHSMDQMLKDPIFSVLQDSTISFPAIAQCGGVDGDEETQAVVPVRKSRSTATKEKLLPAFRDALNQAQELLLDVHTSSYSKSDSSMVHRVAALLQNTVIVLSALSSTSTLAASYSPVAMVAADLARNITWKREQKASDAPAAVVDSTSRSKNMKKRRSSFHPISDLSRFQLDYIEKIPKNWNVISLSLSENNHELCMTKYQAGHGPFILRLPLERAQSRDVDTDTINFEGGRKELLEIIRLANETSHSARDFTVKDERHAWWAEREALDVKLGELLNTIENAWLGGFKGLFSQHQPRSDLLARFQKNFEAMLDSCLPSRNGMGRNKTSKAARIKLDARILELFIGLGDPTDADLDMDEALNDLLYFVVDILQFHGERNAYDEIDFDAMVVETYDALRAYYDASKKGRKANAHTILVLDKALHVFPWESLPCMQNSAVSRVPSLACLRQLINEAQGLGDDDEEYQGHHVSTKSGTYILNPSSDLKNTETFFQPAFSTLETWTGIIKKEPTEASFETALTKSEILLYFGHGSGAQYVRSKTIKKLDRCKPATFLMGCSSAALSTAGEFECYGPVWNYLMAGCPAVVGALWDVTDRDIDRFSGRAFEEWGLFPRGTFRDRKKGKAKAEEDEEELNNGQRRGPSADMEEGCEEEGGKTSLVEAVAKARSVCRFRYLNAAAVVVYGIPTYLKGKGEE